MFNQDSKRFAPESFGYLYRVLACARLLKKQGQVYADHPMDKLFDKVDIEISQVEPVSFQLLLDGNQNQAIDMNQLIGSAMNMLFQLSVIVAEQASFLEQFAPFKTLLDDPRHQNMLETCFKEQVYKFNQRYVKAKLTRRPLQLQKRKAIAIASFVPKFNERFSLDRKSHDPNRERAEQQKLKYQYKKEFKGAVRELKKDAEFIAREKIQNIKVKDAQYKKRMNQIMGELGDQEGTMKGIDKQKKKMKRF